MGFFDHLFKRLFKSEESNEPAPAPEGPTSESAPAAQPGKRKRIKKAGEAAATKEPVVPPPPAEPATGAEHFLPIEREAARLDVSVSSLVAAAWGAAKETMRLTSSVLDPKD